MSWLNEAGGTGTPCGNMEAAQADRAAFCYCPANKVIYYDYSRLRELHAARGYDGILAMLAHEYGHHVQNLLGERHATVALDEWEADCYSGTALRWFQMTGMPRLSRAGLSDLAYSTGGGDHGSGEDRRSFWQYGWDKLQWAQQSGQSTDQFACYRLFNQPPAK
jgi:Putative neutral zinc metallopeptidase